MFLPAALLAAVPAAPPGGGTPLPDIRGPEDVIHYISPSNPFWLLLALVCLILAGLVAWYFLFRTAPPKPVPALSPREIAERRLRELATRIGSLDARAFGNEVADVLRVFIGGQFGLHPERQTSQEFLGSVTGSRAFTRTEHVMLADFLEGCDLLKFARADATLERKEYLLNQATEFVQSSAPPGLGEVGSGKSEVGSQTAVGSPT